MNKAVSVFLLFICLACASSVKNPFEEIHNSADPNYGYSAENPIRIGNYGDPNKNVRACYLFMSRLTTTGGRTLEIVSRASVSDPQNNPSSKGFLGLPMRGSAPRGGILDAYILVPVDTSDSLTLYFDIYHKDQILVPKGLLFVRPQFPDTIGK